MKITDFCDRVIKLGFYLLFALTPLLLTPWNYELFEYNKMMAVYGITTIIFTAWIVKMLHEKEIRIAKTPLDIPIALFVTSQFVSSLFSMDPHVSWFGYYSRFNGGMWSIISYVLLYYAFISHFTPLPNQSRQSQVKSQKSKVKSESDHSLLSTFDSELSTLLRVALATATVVALYGVAERLGIDKHLWVQDVQNRVFSTLGQPNWLAAYLVALIPVSMAFALKSQASSTNDQTNLKHQTQNTKQSRLNIWNLNIVWNLRFVIWNFATLLFFIVLLFTRSRSGLLGFAVADILFWTLMFIRPRLASRSPQGEALHTRKPFFLFHLFFALVLFFNGSNIAHIDRYFSLSGLLPSKGEALKGSPAANGPALESGGTESGVIRKYVWQGAVNAWKSSAKTLAVGTGTETFAFAFYRHRPAGHNQTSEWDFLYNKAHNEYLNYLATTGVLGLGSYILFIGTFIVWFFRNQMSKHKGQINVKAQKSNHLDFGAWCLRVALFAGWLSILVTNFFGFSVVIVQVFLFLLPAMIITTHTFYSRKIAPPPWVAWCIMAIGTFVLIRIASLWWADTRYALGYRYNRSGQFSSAKQALEQAILLNSGEPVYRDEMATTLTSLSVDAFEKGNATAAATLAQEALAQNDRAIRISPANVNFWKTRTKVYYSLATFDPTLNDAAITALERAAALSPNDPKIYYNLAILEGRSGNNEQAIKYLLRSKDLKPNYRDAYYGLYIFYTELKQPKEGQEILREYLTSVDPNDTDFQTLIQ